MKKLAAIIISISLFASSIYGAEGEMGCFGGITSGVKLETITASLQTKKKTTTTKYTLPYKENIYLSGKAQEVEGTVIINPGKEIDKEEGSGTYTESYKMTAQNKDGSAKITRNITMETQYIYEADRKQTTKVTTAKKWSEIVTVDGKTYTLEEDLSNFSKSVLIDYTPAVEYYSGTVQYDAVYKGLEEGDSNITVSVSSPIYGYEQAYAKTETQRRTITIDFGNNNGYAVQETPTFTVYRDIDYAANEPTAISMEGNYKEIIRGEGALSFTIVQGSSSLNEDDYQGMLSVQSSPTVEQLSIPTALNVKGHPAEAQIKKMFSMKIFDDNAKSFSTNQAVTRKEYIAMLVKALRIPLPEEKTSSRSRKNQEVEVSPFSDVAITDPYYKYLSAAYKAGLVSGGNLGSNLYVTREYMYYLNVKAIGLERLGLGTLDTYTPFVDDNQISSWAQTSIYAASVLGIINPDNGYVFPKKTVTKAECATFLDQLINYLRYDLQKDYNDKLLIG